MQVSIDKIDIGDRHRTDLGDIEGLATSIADIGLLQPIGVTADMKLVYGERRLAACRDVLGLTEIEVRTVDVPSIIEGEFAENEMRKAFTPSERVAIADAIKEQLGERRGRPKKNGGNCTTFSGTTDPENVENFPHLNPSKNNELPAKGREIAAKKAGLGSSRTYELAKKVVEKAVPELVAAMDSGEVSISAAAKVAERPKLDQRQYLETTEHERRKLRRVKNAQASKTVHEQIQGLKLCLEELANTTVTAAEYRALALPHTLKVTREWAVKVMAFLSEILEDETNDTSRASETTFSHPQHH